MRDGGKELNAKHCSAHDDKAIPNSFAKPSVHSPERRRSILSVNSSISRIIYNQYDKINKKSMVFHIFAAEISNDGSWPLLN